MALLRRVIRKAYDHIGLVALLSILMAGAAAVAQHESGLPGGYTWLRPWYILFLVVCNRHFPLIALVTLLIAWNARRTRSGTRFRDLIQALNQHVDIPPGRVITAAATAVLLLAIGSLLCPDHDLLDRISLLTIGGFLGAQRASRRQSLVFFGNLVFAVLVFMLVSYGFTVFKALLFRVEVPHDAQIMAFEHRIFGVYPHRLVANWIRLHKAILMVLDQTYYRLFDHMILVSLFLIGLKMPEQRTEFLSALAVCYILGAGAYYIYPALGPGYADPHTYQYLNKMTVMTKFFRARLWWNTRNVALGHATVLHTYDYIACMPSLHLAHEFVMLYYSRFSRIALFLSALFTAITGYAVIALGWHYPTDIVAGFLLAMLALGICHIQREHLFPRVLAPMDVSPKLPD